MKLYNTLTKKVEDFVSYYMAQPTEHNLVEMEDVTKNRFWRFSRKTE